MDAKNESAEAPKLSDLEWEVMKPLWEHGPMAARDIYERVPETYGWAYETVKTMLARLVKKGALTYDQIGNSFLYRPAYTRAEMTREATGSFIQRVFDGALNPFLAHFAEHVSKEELQKIRQELARIEKKRREEK
ncbi:MAG: BlaI/MecI/CopY family transcriptional regulator [Candidatus Hydrogenedentes bacterium]|nr:BlaI/MecI/CopY family transcriptional regulator [Candidatus Hydrogenedentota bacterium]